MRSSVVGHDSETVAYLVTYLLCICDVMFSWTFDPVTCFLGRCSATVL